VVPLRVAAGYVLAMADDVIPEVRTWLADYAGKLGVPAPTDAELETLLQLAGVAARSSARQAAPVACWLAARAGVDPARALDLAKG
jgi:hypothetical protein